MIDDIDQIMAVMERAFDPHFGEAWSRRQVEDALVMGNCHYLLVGEDGSEPDQGQPAAGFSLSRTGVDEEELLLFAVMPGHRGKGLGGRLLTLLAVASRARGAERLLLEMRRGNPAESLYRRFGFLPVGERPKYYRTSDGTRLDAVTFAVDLSQ